MSVIHKLDDITINKIAAGEVIENPSSVVKELVDNALDALGTEIHIDIRGGGRELIRVKDNGSGMGKEDALLCLERHATSKLKNIDDLQNLFTRGFRGEAIPSIASVSKMTLKTCLKGEKIGTLIVVDGGVVTLNTEAALEEGTQIEVENLFFNVPVRRKFQKSPSYDASEVEKMLTLLSLGHPNVSFHLTHNGKTLFHTKKEGGPFLDALKGRMETLLPEEFSKSVYKIDEKQGDYHLQGYLLPPFINRPNKTGQYVFINGRAVNSPLISFAVKEAFGYSMAQNRYPLFVLFLETAKEKVDINVHPQKKEVRFQQEPHLREFIVNAIEKNLQIFGEAPVVQFTPKEKTPFPEIKVDLPKTPYKPLSIMPKQATSLKPVAAITPTATVQILASIAPYIIALIDEEPYLFDQVRLKNRLFFDQMTTGTLQSQHLLIPFSIPCKGLNLDGFEFLGFLIKQESDTLLVEAIPSILSQEEAKTFLNNAIHEPVEGVIQEQKKQLTKRLAGLTSKKRLHPFEAEALVKNVLKLENNVLCPFGFPLRVPLTADKLKNLMG